jgi:homoserine kinase type II
MTNTEILNEAVSKFLSTADSYTFKPTSGGVNNIVVYVEDVESHQTFILRVYNNGNDSRKVVFEHAVLAELQKIPLSFKVPSPIPSKETKETHVPLSNGAEASLFEVIPGFLPHLTMVKEIGMASGELCTALSKIHIDESVVCPNPPYYDLYKVHHFITREKFLAAIETDEFQSFRTEMKELEQEIVHLEDLIVELQSLNLPEQYIHGDLHYDNILVDETNDVTGLLDFEFVAYDWRAMELAICLSKYCSETNPLDFLFPFIEGFFATNEDGFTDLEISVLPDLINLRILSNVVYFVGRILAKEDQITCLNKRAGTYLSRIQWIKKNREKIIQKLKESQKKMC